MINTTNKILYELENNDEDFIDWKQVDEIAELHDEYFYKIEGLKRIFFVISLCAAVEYGKRLGLDKAFSVPIKWYTDCDKVISQNYTSTKQVRKDKSE